MQIRAVVAAAVLWASHGVAQPIQAGLDWLRLQQGPDGLLGGATAEEPIVATNEALAVWRALSLDGTPEYGAAAAGLSSTVNPFPDTELRVRRDAAVSAPFSWPNSLTHAPGFERSEAHLLALSLIDAIDTGTEVWSARAARLIQLVPADGCLRWADNDADAELIALGLLALRPADDLPNSAVARQRLAACLSGLQRPGGDFGSSTATSLSVLALETVIGTSPAQTTAARAHLSALQRADGSWGSVRATALAIRALTGGAPDWSNRLSLSSGEVFSSEQVTASLEVRNVAGVPAPTSSWEVRALGQNGSIVALGSGLVPPLASGATVTIPTVFATSALSGPYRIEARIDPFQLQPELDRTNNVASAPLNVVAADDLAITSQGITFSPGTTSATATVSATVRNLGRTVQTAARVEVWKGSPSNGSSLGSFFIPIGLATNATFTGSVQLPLAGLGPVTAISVDVDADDALSEVDESNNRAFRYFEGGAQAPVDLALTEPQPDLPSLVFANAPFQLPVVVKNLSSNDARRVLVRALDAAGTSVGQAEVELVQANGQTALSISLTLATSSTIQLVVDPLLELTDTSRANNSLSRFISITSRPNLLVNSVSPRDGVTGATTVTATVINQGSTPSTAVAVVLRLGGERLEVGRHFMNLAAGESRNIDFSNVSAGADAVFQVCADATNTVDEANENDNCAEFARSTNTSTLTVNARTTRLEPVGADVGDAVHASTVVKNSSTFAATALVEWWVGAPDKVGSVRLAERPVSVPANDEVVATFDFVRPEGPPELYARLRAALPNSRSTPAAMEAGRHFFLEEILDFAGVTPDDELETKALRSGDLDGDGVAELVIGYQRGRTVPTTFGVEVLERNASGAWARRWNQEWPLWQSGDLILLDVDGSGTPEVVVLRYLPLSGLTAPLAAMDVLTASGAERWSRTWTPGGLNGTSDSSTELGVGDLDGDGVVELIAADGSIHAFTATTGAPVLESTVPGTPSINLWAGLSRVQVLDPASAGTRRIFYDTHLGQGLKSTDGTQWWHETTSFNHQAIIDFDLDGLPEALQPAGDFSRLYSLSDVVPQFRNFALDSIATLAVGDLQQRGTPHAVGVRWARFIPGAQFERVAAVRGDGLSTWDVRPQPRVISPAIGVQGSVALADLLGLGRPQVLLTSCNQPLMLFEGRTGDVLLSAVDGTGGGCTGQQPSGNGPTNLVVASLAPAAPARVIVPRFRFGSGAVGAADYGRAEALVFASPKWKPMPTAWPTRYLIKGRIDEQLKWAGGAASYRWWTQHNTSNQQFLAEPARLLADLTVSWPPQPAPRLGIPGVLLINAINEGGVAASGATVTLYDGRPGVGAVIGTATAGLLGVRGGTAQLSVPWSAWPEGDHELCAVINEAEAIEESGRENNTACIRVEVRANGSACDLALDVASLNVAPLSASPGESVQLTARVVNEGTTPCNATQLTVRDGAGTNASLLGTTAVPALDVGGQFTATVLALAPAGTRLLRFEVEPGAALDGNSSNNEATLEAFFSNATVPDFLIEAVTLTPQPAFPGEHVTVTLRVWNRGTASPSTRLALSSGESATVPALAAGARASVSVELNASATALLTAVVDPDAAVAESDEANNARDFTVTTQSSNVSLAVVATPQVAGPNTHVALGVTTTNAGAARAAALVTRVVAPGGQVLQTSAVSLALPQQSAVVSPLSWDTGSHAPGRYLVTAELTDGTRLLAASSAPLDVIAGTPSAAAALAADRGSYLAGSDVLLTLRLENTSGNAALAPLQALLSVRDPSGTAVLTEVRQLGTLVPSGVRTASSLFELSPAATPGNWTATVTISDGTTTLANAGTSFTVRDSPVDAVTASLSAPPAFQVGPSLPLQVSLLNAGSVALTNALLSVELVDLQPGLAVESSDALLVGAPPLSSSNFALTLPTTGIPPGQKLLVLRLAGRILERRLIDALPLTDTEPPHIEVSGITDGAYTRQDVRPVVTVTDVSAFTAVVTLDGAPFTAGQVVSAEGLHTLAVDAEDAFGNRSLLVVRFTIDKTPPVLTLLGPADGSLHLVAQSLTWNATDASPVTTSGTLNGAPILSGAVVATEGDFVWAVRAEDAAGNFTLETRRFGIDVSAPVIVLVAPAQDAYVRSPASLDWTVTDAHPGTVVATLDGVTVTAPLNVTMQGAHTLVITATDPLGNASSVSRSFTIDDTPPVVVVSGVTPNQVTRGPVTPLVTVTDDSPLTLTLTLDGAPFISGTPVDSEGVHELIALARDAASNERSVTVRFTIDRTEPVISITGVADGAFRNSPVTVSFSASDATLASVSAALDGAPFSSGGVVASAGAHTLVVTALDQAGNSATRTLSFTLDFTAPTITITGVTNGASGASFTPVVTFFDASPLTTSLTLDGANFASGTTVTAPGTHVLVASAQDAAGNSASTTVSFTVVVPGGQCVDVSFDAERRYSPSRWYDARYRFSAPVRIAVPWTLDVTAGNAGNKKAYLFFTLGNSTTRCEYRGGSPVAHPHQSADVNAGKKYRFVKCTSGVTAGSMRTVDDVRLHLHDGDSQRGTTKVTWRFQESQPCAGATAQRANPPAGRHCPHESASCDERDCDRGDDDDDSDDDDDDDDHHGGRR